MSRKTRATLPEPPAGSSQESICHHTPSWGATDAAGLVLGVMGTLSHVRNTSELKELSHGGIETQSWTNYSSVLWVRAVEGGEALCLSRTNGGLINPSSGSQERWNWSGSSLTTLSMLGADSSSTHDRTATPCSVLPGTPSLLYTAAKSSERPTLSHLQRSEIALRLTHFWKM